MIYQQVYKTPAGFSDLIMSSDGESLIGLWFEHSKSAGWQKQEIENKKLPIFEETSAWLTQYFQGKVPNFIPHYKLEGVTPFRKEVLDILNTINYGETLTYGEVSWILAKNRGIKKMSAQAVGGAVGWNPICIIIPCHRVVGVNGKLTGYGGGLQNKKALLVHEGIYEFKRVSDEDGSGG